MIEKAKDLPDNVAAFAVRGDVTKTDYDTVLIPDFEDRLGPHKKVRIYCEIAPDFASFEPGAVPGWRRCFSSAASTPRPSGCMCRRRR